MLILPDIKAAQQYLNDLLFNNVARTSFLLFSVSILSGVLGYAFQVLMGRMLGLNEYGLFVAIMALFSIMAVPLGTIGMLASRQVSKFRSLNEYGNIKFFYFFIQRKAMIVGVVLFCVYIFISPSIQNYLKSEYLLPIILLGVTLFTALFQYINNAFLQGLQLFGWLSSSTIIFILFKIIFATFFVWLGYGLIGAINGVIISWALAALVVYFGLLRIFPIESCNSCPQIKLPLGSSFTVLLANASFAIMTQIDIVLVNYYFLENDVGLYAAASILAKAVLYLPSGIALAIFPMTAENHEQNKSSSHLLKQAVVLTSVLCGVGASIYLIFSDAIISMLYGDAYLGAGDILKYFGFAMLPMAIVMVVENYLIAKGTVIFAYIFVLIAPLQILAIYYFHDSLITVVGIVALFGLLLVTLGIAMLWLNKRSRKI